MTTWKTTYISAVVHQAGTANSLYFYGGFSAESAKHARELAGAAEIVSEWADELNKEEKQ